MSSLLVRRFEEADAAAVVELSLLAWEPVFESFRNVLGPALYTRMHPDWRTTQAEGVAAALREKETWVAVADPAVIGFVSIDHPEGSDTGEIWMIAVDPAHQRRGAARMLIDVAIEALRDRGVTMVTVSTGGDPGHAPARAAYEARGFVPFPQVYYAQLIDEL